MKNSDNAQLLLDLFRAYYDARKNKRSTVNALAFEANYEEKLFKLCDDIMNRRYKISPSICFIVDRPVKREIFAGDFRDRIVHHLIFNYLSPIFEKHFIGDSYSCRVGKGTSYGIKRVDHFIRSCSENYQKDCWILKLDIRGYFMAMDRNILYAKIERKLKDKVKTEFDSDSESNSVEADVDLILYLIHTVIFNDPTKNCHMKGKREDWVGLPKSKSLFFSKSGNGFPIGNLTSQLFGNIYLDDFDHFVKKKLEIKNYGRYVDDMVFVHGDREYLKSVVSKIGDYLQEELELKIHPQKIYFQHCERGVAFLGTYIKPWRTYAGKRMKGNFFIKIKEWNELIESNGDLSEKEVKDFVACMNSYLGIMKHYDTYKLRKKMLKFINTNYWRYVSCVGNFEKIELFDG